ncbi:hypothetical protein WN48_07986 [Eufriesea mexicana]|uniref:Uncharacterized protein n=1 Tax=Eufriesea mexicana TaxID=516756 RepID=A0A310SJS8_9HYME|nr:hypothetical protein WN48_07986 [Eufriesea mexicana]
MRTREQNTKWIEPVLDGRSAVSRAPFFCLYSTIDPHDARNFSTNEKRTSER